MEITECHHATQISTLVVQAKHKKKQRNDIQKQSILP